MTIGTSRRVWGALAIVAVAGVVIGTVVLLTGGDDATGPTSSSSTDASPTACALEDTGECTLLGVVFTEPLTLDDALARAGTYGGTAFAVYRTDAVCVPEISFAPVPDQPQARVASRFAYVDAPSIKERRLTAIDKGLAPPITGLHTSQTYWTQWENEWRQAQAGGVLIAALAVYTAESIETIAAESGVQAVVPIATRRTDSLDASYPGELLVESKSFPDGHLEPVAPVDCG